MKIYFDTEFIEDDKTIDLISIGLVREDGYELYLENREVDWSKASPWVLTNVFPFCQRDGVVQVTRTQIAKQIQEFAGEKPEFWAYYADYDWVVLCQLYGTMMQLPPNFPMFCRDVRQLMDGKPRRGMPKQLGVKHHALEDARWVRDAYLWLEKM